MIGVFVMFMYTHHNMGNDVGWTMCPYMGGYGGIYIPKNLDNMFFYIVNYDLGENAM